MTAAAWTVTLLVLAVWADAELPGGHHDGLRRLGCMRRNAAYCVTRAVLVAAIWAAGRVRAERGRP